ncbi:MAG: RNA-binding protein [Candidatus Lokiarchaeota archaeon]|nr:RNA-binding protein [Candidatus Lokiarchaeota archaeon]
MQQSQSSLVKVLKRALGKRCLVVLKRDLSVNGILRGFDQHLNLHIDNAVTTNPHTLEIETLGTIVLRGDSVLLVNCEDLVEKHEEE